MQPVSLVRFRIRSTTHFATGLANSGGARSSQRVRIYDDARARTVGILFGGSSYTGTGLVGRPTKRRTPLEGRS